MTGSPNGSSPLARGLLVCVFEWRVCVGIIPARAGFTLDLEPLIPALSDHPRSRGVYCAVRSPARKSPGSSPLARGLRVCVSGVDVLVGIIPARAGFTTCVRWCASHAWDHPRSRGVYMFCLLVVCPDHPRSRGVYLRRSVGSGRTGGSSPLARGLRAGRAVPAVYGGIIPARAGFTSWVSCTRR